MDIENIEKITNKRNLRVEIIISTLWLSNLVSGDSGQSTAPGQWLLHFQRPVGA
jgi:hypothetical protein